MTAIIINLGRQNSLYNTVCQPDISENQISSTWKLSLVTEVVQSFARKLFYIKGWQMTATQQSHIVSLHHQSMSNSSDLSRPLAKKKIDDG